MSNKIDNSNPKLFLSVPADEIESGALTQIRNILDLQCLVKLAILPDVHCGYDMPIGGVGLFKKLISPACVGYDIACGMAHQLVTDPSGDMNPMEMAAAMGRSIPVGYRSLNKGQQLGCDRFTSALCDVPGFEGFAKDLTRDVRAKSDAQCGTLGSGNHFLELGVNDSGQHALTVHSGSRNPGHTIATYYMRIAKEYGVKDGKLNFFTGTSDLGMAYRKDVKWATTYAYRSRNIMLSQAAAAIGVQFIPRTYINEAHNTVDDMGDGTYLHRKGATPAENGQLGIIPIHMKEGVYITKGLGFKEALNSASHGAGRLLSRKKAKTLVHPDDVVKMLGEIGHVPGDYRDEHEMAYKVSEYVLPAQEGRMVDIVDHFRPVSVLKG